MTNFWNTLKTWKFMFRQDTLAALCSPTEHEMFYLSMTLLLTKVSLNIQSPVIRNILSHASSIIPGMETFLWSRLKNVHQQPTGYFLITSCPQSLYSSLYVLNRRMFSVLITDCLERWKISLHFLPQCWNEVKTLCSLHWWCNLEPETVGCGNKWMLMLPPYCMLPSLFCLLLLWH